MGSRIKLKEMLEMYGETIDKARFLGKRFFPLHRKLKNVYRKNKTHQDEIKKLKAELHPFKDELDKRNLDMIAKVATKRISRTKKKKINALSLLNQHQFWSQFLFHAFYNIFGDGYEF